MVKELTGLQINHVVNVDFLGFVRAVDAIGCVYIDVDRRYYHSNVGLPPSEQYSEINIQPGYQLLCGKKALQYVRYRHTDTDLVRSARQQDFISAARQQVSIQDLVFDQSDLIDIFTKYTTSDINDKETMLQVLKLFIASRNAAIKEVHFPAELGPSFVYSDAGSDPRSRSTCSSGSEASGGPRGSLEDSEPKKTAARARRRRQEAARRKKAKPEKPHIDKPSRPAATAWCRRAKRAKLEAKSAARKVGGGFPVFYPTRLPSGAYYVESNSYEHIQDPRVYHLKDTDEERHAAYRMVGDLRTRRRHPLLRDPGDPGLGGPADPQRPEP